MFTVTSKSLATRRRFLRQLAAGGAFYSVSGLFAEALTLTPKQTQGPFYPLAKNIPLDKDNDLVIVDDHLTPAKGIITFVSGRVLDNKGEPIRNALVELWHTDDGGQYVFSSDAPRNPKADSNFAGFGQFLTGSDGAYKFRTIKAGLYRGRTRHYHFGITIPGQKARFTTQLYWNEVPHATDGSVWSTTNENDGVLRGVSDPAERAAVIRDFTALAGSAAGEQETSWDIVMGLTPFEQPYPGAEDGVSFSQARRCRQHRVANQGSRSPCPRRQDTVTKSMPIPPMAASAGRHFRLRSALPTNWIATFTPRKPKARWTCSSRRNR